MSCYNDFRKELCKNNKITKTFKFCLYDYMALEASYSHIKIPKQKKIKMVLKVMLLKLTID